MATLAKLVVELSLNADKYKKGIGEATKATKGIGSQVKKDLGSIRDGWTNVLPAVAAAAGAIYTAKKAFDFGKEGAQIIKVRDTFDKLAISIGENSQTILDDLRRATEGMVSDTELMASSNRFLSMGLANTGAEASKLSRIAVTLGAAMGKDASAAMEEFALLLANQSIPRLDTFGISAGRVRTQIQELQAANKNMSRETAFMKAVMDEAEASMEKLGDSVPTDPFTQFEVNTKNLTDELKIMAAEGLGPVVAAVNEYITAMKDGAAAVEEKSAALNEGVLSIEENEIAIKKLANAYDEASTFIGSFTGQAPKLRDQLEQSLVLYAGQVDSLKDFQKAVYDAGISERDFYLLMVRTTEEFYEQEGAIGRAEREARILQQTYDALSHIQNIYSSGAKDAAENTEEVADALEEAKKAAEAAAGEWDELTDVMATGSGVIQVAKRHLDDMLASASMGRSWEQAQKGLGLFNEELEDLGPMMVTIGGRTADQNALLDEARDKYNDLGREIARMTAAPELYGLTVEEAAEKTAKLAEEQGTLIPLMDRLGGVTGTTRMVIKEATVNQDALNKALFDSVQAATDNTDKIVAMGLATGELTQAQADAIIKAIELQAAVDAVSEAFLSGAIDADQARDALLGVSSGLYDTAQDAIEAQIRVDDAREALENIAGNWQALLDIKVDTGELERALAKVQELKAETFVARQAMATAATSGSSAATTTQPTRPQGGRGETFQDAYFRVPLAGPPMTATFAPGDFVMATKDKPGEVTNNYILNMESGRSMENLKQDFDMMRALAGAV